MPSPLELISSLVRAAGPAVSSRAFTPRDLPSLQEALAPFTRPRALPPDRSAALTSLLQQSRDPGITTHLLFPQDDLSPLAAYQLTRRHGLDPEITGLYMPNLVSLSNTPGVGVQTLQDARSQGPFSLVTTPGARGFYEKMTQRLPGFQRHPNPEFNGIAYEYRADGGRI